MSTWNWVGGENSPEQMRIGLFPWNRALLTNSLNNMRWVTDDPTEANKSRIPSWARQADISIIDQDVFPIKITTPKRIQLHLNLFVCSL